MDSGVEHAGEGQWWSLGGYCEPRNPVTQCSEMRSCVEPAKRIGRLAG